MEYLPEHEDNGKMVEMFQSADAVSATPQPYAPFSDSLKPDDLQPVSPIEALREDAEISQYLKQDKANRRRHINAGIGFLVCAILFGLVGWAFDWSMFQTYTPPPVASTPKPRPYTGDPPLAFQDSVGVINAEIRAGDKWGPVFEQLKILAGQMNDSVLAVPDELKMWVYGEMLVAMASKEVSPAAYDETLPDTLFATISSLTRVGEPIPLRVGFAYVRLLHSRNNGENLPTESNERILSVLEQLRGQHPEEMDQNREILAIEAEHHIAALPREYRENDRYLEFHWRRAAHAIQRLYQMPKTPGDAVHLKLDRLRWEKIYSYFDFTIMTLSYSKFGRIRSVTLDGREYTRDEVEAILRSIAIS